MGNALSIGDFSRVTHLSVKTLRHYHDAGLLEPDQVDPHSGYRYYTTTQIPTAQVIRRFRDLGMPVREVGEVLATTDPEARSTLIAGHLHRLENELAHTREAVASLRRLLGGWCETRCCWDCCGIRDLIIRRFVKASGEAADSLLGGRARCVRAVDRGSAEGAPVVAGQVMAVQAPVVLD
jgi:DNA-binding transcriptional MerR regulator